jgi:hypothetical protein
MAGKKPSFITGATAKIRIGNLTIAYAEDVSYSTTVTTIPIETMGRYEVVSNEPVAYFVDGTLSIIRYTKEAGKKTQDNKSIYPGAAINGNSVNQIGISAGLDPSKMIASETFDVEIFQKFQKLDSEGKPQNDTISVVKLRDCRVISRSGAITKRGVLTERFSFKAIYIDDDIAVGGSGDIDLE